MTPVLNMIRTEGQTRAEFKTFCKDTADVYYSSTALGIANENGKTEVKEPTLYILSGLPGSGKLTLAQELAKKSMRFSLE